MTIENESKIQQGNDEVIEKDEKTDDFEDDSSGAKAPVETSEALEQLEENTNDEIIHKAGIV